jgi:hypothetical protein
LAASESASSIRLDHLVARFGGAGWRVSPSIHAGLRRLSLLAATGLLFRRALLSPVPLHRALGLGMTAGLAGLLAHAVGANTFLIIRIMEPFWLLTGLVTASLHMEGRS